MQILVVGLNHETTPVEIREKLALGKWQLKEALVSLSDYVPEGVILSTCNRTEVYTLADKHCSERAKLEDFLSKLGDLPRSKLAPHLYAFHQEAAASHLFRIASGLESMIVGEYEVLGQVRQALEDAENADFLSLPLLNLFRQAVRVGRRARNETGISRNAISVSSVAIDLARTMFDEPSNCKVLIVSSGEAGQLAVKALVKQGISQLIVTSRSHEKAVALASKYGGSTVPFHHIKEALAEVDIVISSSGAPHFILESSVVAEAMQSRPNRPLVLIDIAVPRDIDPQVTDIEGIRLYDIDDLQTISESNHRRRSKEKGKVTAIIDTEVVDFMSWYHSLEAVPTITALVGKAEKIRRTQLAKTLSGIQMSDEDRAAIEAMTQSIVKKILHGPIQSLKNGGEGSNRIKEVQELFDLDANV